MKKKERIGSEKCELQMTPMIDVVFQLLIFFIVALKQQDIFSHLDVERPATPVKPPIEIYPDVELLQITVHADGFTLQGRPVTVHKLDEKISRIATYSPTASVIIRCTKDSSHGRLVEVLDVCAKNKMKNINLFSQ